MHFAMRPIRVCVERLSTAQIEASILMCLVTTFVQGQIFPSLSDTSAQSPHLHVGMTRIAFTSVFHADAFIEQMIGSGQLVLRQQYRGASLLTGTTSFRDDELFRLEWRYGVADRLRWSPRLEWDLSNDSRSLGISRLERFRLAAETSYHSTVGLAEGYIGFERAMQLGVSEQGGAVGLRIVPDQINVGEIAISTGLTADHVRLKVRRNTDFRAHVTLSSPSAETLPFEIQLVHQRQQRDYYTTLGSSTTIALEHRAEERWEIRSYLQQQVGDWLSVSVQPFATIIGVERYFDAPDFNSALTYVRRRLDELNATVIGKLNVQTATSQHEIGAELGYRMESNATFDRFATPTPQLIEEIRQSERMRDNQTQRVQLWVNNLIQVTSTDTLRVVALNRLVRYDTPSPLNYDDRDELTQTLQLVLHRRWSAPFSSVITSEYTVTHLVFLPSQRSALSNTMRLLRLGSWFRYAAANVRWFPSCEVVAQYTVYDFEGLSGVPSSFSFRQFSYRDSLALQLSFMQLEVQCYLRWFIRGDFVWTRFAEYPTGNGSEQFFRIMAWRQVGTSISLGVGGRWYALVQQMQPTALAPLIGIQRSIAPETSVRLSIDKLDFVINGWYEVRLVQGVTVQYLPNVQINLIRRW